MPSSRTCVGVVFGGASEEHAVSIRSAITVVGALRSEVNNNCLLYTSPSPRD